MKNVWLVVAAAGMIGCFGYNHFAGHRLAPLYEKPYVILYGNPSCFFCQKMEDDLKENEIPFVFKDIREETVKEEVLPRMASAGIDTKEYDYPVIDVSGRIFVRPDIKTVMAIYKE